MGLPTDRVRIIKILCILALTFETLSCKNKQVIQEMALLSSPPSLKKTENIPDEEMPAVYRDYGPLFVEEGDWEQESSLKPWSAWWYPIRDRGLLKTLDKYDTYVRQVHHIDSHASQYEEQNLYNSNAEPWEGLCHAWAFASLLVPEPHQALHVGGIEFSINDQKALLIKTFERYVATYYGEPFSRREVSNWSDIQPHLFHRFVFGELIEKSRPFIMNKVPGLEIWNLPVWKAAIHVQKDEKDPLLFHVKTWTVGASILPQPSNQVGMIPEINIFTYDLFIRRDQSNRNFVYGGKWTGLSEDAHPSVLISVPTKLEEGHESRNPYILNKWVQEILGNM